jgi:UDP-2,3-diacylglucosamine pyrophosphatase LpxH
MKYKTIVISDLHLGTKDAKIDEVVSFLKENSCDNLFLNGDIIDGWHLKRGGKWSKKETKFIKKIMKLVANNKTKVIYIRGNHDDFLEHFIPFSIGNDFEIKNDHIYESFDKKYLIIHGDVFDSITSKMSWLAHLGSIGYDLLLYLNRRHNKKRAKRGLPYKSLSQEIKKKVKIAINILFKFEKNAILFTKMHKCDGIICGHIHTPEDKIVDGIRYMNSGDWVETKSALVEDFNGNWKIINN